MFGDNLFPPICRELSMCISTTINPGEYEVISTRPWCPACTEAVRRQTRGLQRPDTWQENMGRDQWFLDGWRQWTYRIVARCILNIKSAFHKIYKKEKVTRKKVCFLVYKKIGGLWGKQKDRKAPRKMRSLYTWLRYVYNWHFGIGPSILLSLKICQFCLFHQGLLLKQGHTQSQCSFLHYFMRMW